MTHASQNSHRENQKGRRIAFRDALATEACPGRKRRSRSRKYSVAEAHQPLKLGGYEKSRLDAHRLELLVDEGLGARHVGLLEMLDDDRDVGVLHRQPLEIEVVVERSQAGRRELDGADAAEGMSLRGVDAGMLLRGPRLRAHDILGMRNPHLV